MMSESRPRFESRWAGFRGLARGLPKVARRIVREVLYGVQARGSVRLSEIARALSESTTLKKIIERLRTMATLVLAAAHFGPPKPPPDLAAQPLPLPL